MRAFILAGGLGTRLRSVVSDRPKPLAPINNVPFLEYQIDCLKKKGISDFVLCVGYRHEQIEEHFATGERLGVTIRYSIEQQPLGTAGALKLAERFADETFLVFNGDTFFDLNLDELVTVHQREREADSKLAATLALVEVADPSAFGSVELDDAGRIRNFREKADPGPAPHYVNAGVYVIEPALLDSIPANCKVSLERETYPGVLASGKRLRGHRTDGSFIDIGTPEGYRIFQEYAEGIPS